MKKLINIFIVILFVLTLTVKADSGGPTFPTLPGNIKNDNVKCYEDFEIKGNVEVTFNKGQAVDVRYVDGKRYEYVSEDHYCYIDANDLILGKNKYELSSYYKLTEPYDLLIVNPEGVQMYSGPLEEYDKLNMVIPSGTVLKTYYQIGTFWYYVTYNEVSGYINSSGNYIVHKYNEDDDNKYVTIDDYDITDINDKKIGSLPALSDVTDSWYTDESRQMYITYNGTSGFIPGFLSTATECTGTKIKPLGTSDVYKTIIRYERKSMKKVGTAETNKEYQAKYCFSGQGDSAYYVESLGGWLYFELSEKPDFIETDKNGEVFDSREYKEKHLLEKIEVAGYNLYFEKNVYTYNLEISEQEDKLNITYQPDYDDEIKVTITGNENLKNNSKITIKVRDDEGEHTYTIIVSKKSATPVSPPAPASEDKNSEIIWICLGACLLIVVTTIVVIILVNKKKKDKEVKEEVRVVPSSNAETNKEDTSENKELEEDNKNELED